MGFFSKTVQFIKDHLSKTRQKISSSLSAVLTFGRKIDEQLLDELEQTLIGDDIGVETTERLISDIRTAWKAGKVKSAEEIVPFLKEQMKTYWPAQDRQLKLAASGPTVILVAGINGSGKTTSIAKLAHILSRNNKKVVVAACDTFRAAAVEQLSIWAERIGVQIVRHQQGSDPAAVAYAACQAAFLCDDLAIRGEDPSADLARAAVNNAKSDARQPEGEGCRQCAHPCAHLVRYAGVRERIPALGQEIAGAALLEIAGTVSGARGQLLLAVALDHMAAPISDEASRFLRLRAVCDDIAGANDVRWGNSKTLGLVPCRHCGTQIRVGASDDHHGAPSKLDPHRDFSLLPPSRAQAYSLGGHATIAVIFKIAGAARVQCVSSRDPSASRPTQRRW
jgi:energy-coupling factor transporter ATP-binding protein EcfA2